MLLSKRIVTPAAAKPRGVRVCAFPSFWAPPAIQPQAPASPIEYVAKKSAGVVDDEIKLLKAPAVVDLDDGSGDEELIALAKEEQRRRAWFQATSFVIQNGVSLFLLGIIIYSVIMMSRASKNGPGLMSQITQSTAKLANPSTTTPDGEKITFDKIAGQDAPKRELSELIDFLKTPGRYEKVGAVIPKGYLLVGPSGTGKTMLSVAVANEADVPFFYCSAAEFLQVYVGIGAARVRDLFSKAKEKSPCIIFIDEIDAIGKARSSGQGFGGNDEREQTINQLLTELDGFEPNKGVIVIAATNRADMLDKALLRPGRFDRQITVGLPDAKGREDILRVHTANKPLSTTVNLNALSRVTPGFSGADLKNLANEAAIHAAREHRTEITHHDFEAALEKITIGLERKGAYISPDKRRLVAYHEAGHALTAILLEDYDEVRKVTISPRGGTGGTTQFLPDPDRLDSGLYTKEYMEKSLCVALGGRAAEEIVFGPSNITTGATGDMTRVYQVARAMVTTYGFNDIIGPVSYPQDAQSQFSQTPLSPDLASIVDFEVIKMAATSYAKTIKLVRNNRKLLDIIADALLEHETITGEEIAQIIAAQQATA